MLFNVAKVAKTKEVGKLFIYTFVTPKTLNIHIDTMAGSRFCDGKTRWVNE